MAMVPLTFVLAYYADLAYGSKLYRIRGSQKFHCIPLQFKSTDPKAFFFLYFTAEADMIMQNESDLLEWPLGLPTVSSIDQARVDIEMQKKLHPIRHENNS